MADAQFTQFVSAQMQLQVVLQGSAQYECEQSAEGGVVLPGG